MRKFYKTKIVIVVLSEEPYSETNLETIAQDITDGDCSGIVEIVSKKELTGKQTAAALISQGSSPEFFNLDNKGNDLED